MPPLSDYAKQLHESLVAQLMKEPFALTPKQADPIAKWLMRRQRPQWQGEMNLLRELCPTERIVRLVLRTWFAHDHKIYRCTAYQRLHKDCLRDRKYRPDI